MRISSPSISLANRADVSGALTRRRALVSLASFLSLGWMAHRVDAKSTTDAIERGEVFLTKLFDESMDLLPEFDGSKTYWLYHDNYLAAKLLRNNHATVADRVEKRIASFGVKRSGKIEIVFGEIEGALPFRHHQLAVVTQIGDKWVRTEKVSDHVMTDWRPYADLLALAALARRDEAEAHRDLEALAKMWDGKGFADRVHPEHKLYATYKLALASIAAHRSSYTFPFETAVRERLASLQSETGGWITDYRADGTPVGMANVETTCLAMLALREAGKEAQSK